MVHGRPRILSALRLCKPPKLPHARWPSDDMEQPAQQTKHVKTCKNHGVVMGGFSAGSLSPPHFCGFVVLLLDLLSRTCVMKCWRPQGVQFSMKKSKQSAKSPSRLPGAKTNKPHRSLNSQPRMPSQVMTLGCILQANCV